MAIKTFDPKNLTITTIGLLGSHSVTGFSDTIVSITMNSDAFNYHTDTSGNVSRFKINDFSAELKITLAQWSHSNSVFTDYYNLDRQTETGIFSIQIKDSEDGSLYFSPSASIKTLPVASYSTDNNNSEWILHADELSWNMRGIGG